MIFKPGDKVILILAAGVMSPSKYQPLWNTSFGCIGTVRSNIEGKYTEVMWANGIGGIYETRRLNRALQYDLQAAAAQTETKIDPNKVFLSNKEAKAIKTVIE